MDTQQARTLILTLLKAAEYSTYHAFRVELLMELRPLLEEHSTPPMGELLARAEKAEAARNGWCERYYAAIRERDEARAERDDRMKEMARPHCWESGPETEDGGSTTCMLWDGHEGDHEWSRDDEIRLLFAPAAAEEEKP